MFSKKPPFFHLSRVLEMRLFELSMWWRILYGTAKSALGIASIWFIGTAYSDIFHTLLRHELIEDPADPLIRFVDSFLSGHPVSLDSFVPVYLIFWGLVDVVLSISLLRRIMWAFPVGLSVISFFVLYEVLRDLHTHSLILFGIILIDLFVLYLIRDEYRRLLVAQTET